MKFGPKIEPCCDPFKTHKNPMINNLIYITGMLAKNHSKYNLIPGKKICSNCRKNLETGKITPELSPKKVLTNLSLEKMSPRLSTKKILPKLSPEKVPPKILSKTQSNLGNQQRTRTSSSSSEESRDSEDNLDPDFDSDDETDFPLEKESQKHFSKVSN